MFWWKRCSCGLWENGVAPLLLQTGRGGIFWSTTSIFREGGGGCCPTFQWQRLVASQCDIHHLLGPVVTARSQYWGGGRGRGGGGGGGGSVLLFTILLPRPWWAAAADTHVFITEGMAGEYLSQRVWRNVYERPPSPHSPPSAPLLCVCSIIIRMLLSFEISPNEDCCVCMLTGSDISRFIWFFFLETRRGTDYSSCFIALQPVEMAGSRR